VVWNNVWKLSNQDGLTLAYFLNEKDAREYIDSHKDAQIKVEEAKIKEFWI
jgi:hypothetical protein